MSKIYVKENRISAGIELIGRSMQTFPSGLGRADLVFLVENRYLEQARLQLAPDNSVAMRDTISPNLGRLSESGEGFVQNRVEGTGGRIAFIYPSPVEKKDVPGFTKFFVSAYFRDTPSDFNEALNQQIVTLTKAFTQTVPVGEEPITYNWTVSERYVVDSVTIFGVVQSNSRALKSPTAELTFQLLSRRISGEVAPGGQTTIDVTFARRTVSITRRPFGRFTEYDLTQTLVPEY